MYKQPFSALGLSLCRWPRGIPLLGTNSSHGVCTLEKTGTSRSLRIHHLDRGGYDEPPLNGTQLNGLFHGLYPEDFPEESIHLKTSRKQYYQIHNALKKAKTSQ